MEQTLVVVVSEVTPDAGCPGYTVTITGSCGTPSPTPTATATPTPTPTYVDTMHGEMCTHTKAASESGTSALGLGRSEKEMHDW